MGRTWSEEAHEVQVLDPYRWGVKLLNERTPPASPERMNDRPSAPQSIVANLLAPTVTYALHLGLGLLQDSRFNGHHRVTSGRRRLPIDICPTNTGVSELSSAASIDGRCVDLSWMLIVEGQGVNRTMLMRFLCSLPETPCTSLVWVEPRVSIPRLLPSLCSAMCADLSRDASSRGVWLYHASWVPRNPSWASGDTGAFELMSLVRRLQELKPLVLGSCSSRLGQYMHIAFASDKSYGAHPDGCCSPSCSALKIRVLSTRLERNAFLFWIPSFFGGRCSPSSRSRSPPSFTVIFNRHVGRCFLQLHGRWQRRTVFVAHSSRPDTHSRRCAEGAREVDHQAAKEEEVDDSTRWSLDKEADDEWLSDLSSKIYEAMVRTLPRRIATIPQPHRSHPSPVMVLGILSNLAVEQARQVQRWATRQQQEQHLSTPSRRSAAPNPVPTADAPAEGGLSARSLGQLRRWERVRAERAAALEAASQQAPAPQPPPVTQPPPSAPQLPFRPPALPVRQPSAARQPPLHQSHLPPNAVPPPPIPGVGGLAHPRALLPQPNAAQPQVRVPQPHPLQHEMFAGPAPVPAAPNVDMHHGEGAGPEEGEEEEEEEIANPRQMRRISAYPSSLAACCATHHSP
ncbi:hypothetical protein NMY22_g13838 [Coprinellus aureogranulatus]|nr:hypothetical protein NMY22_g13838 [Coprinellus aureogranulatus]